MKSLLKLVLKSGGVTRGVSIGFLNLVGDSTRSEGLEDSKRGRKGEDCGEQELALSFSIIFSNMFTG
jgi:hypothetical protein